MELQQNLDKYFNKLNQKNADSPTQILVYSKKHNIDYTYTNVVLDQPFHIASIGKVMTATIIGMLSDKGKLDINNKINSYLSPKMLKGLFVYNEVDYQDKITIYHLLSHTSGIADYFESNTKAGSNFVDQIMQEPEKLWTPQMLIDFTKDNQNAQSSPGKFYYSDTGYILLGMIIEKITGNKFQDVLQEYIFEPLGMKDSYLLFEGKPANSKKQISKVWFNNKEISKLNMLSCDWAGGGIVSSLNDLRRFQTKYWAGGIVGSQFIKLMCDCNNKYRSGIYYGVGMMQLRLEGFFFLLRGLPRLYGHSGILATAMFYDNENDLHVIMNLGSNKRVVESFKSIIYIEQKIKRANQ